MSPATESASTDPTSSSVALDIYVFNCGHGDTILIRLPDGRWGMVDCFLPLEAGVRDRFFEFVKTKGIQTLTFIFQTHPHHDHFHGMEAVIEYFLAKGQKIERYHDSGLPVSWVAGHLNGSPARDEYLRLQNKLDEWSEGKKILNWSALGANHYPVTARCGESRVRFVPLAPDPEDHRRITAKDVKRIAANSNARVSANALSLVLAMSALVEGATFNALLAADAELVAQEKALDCWGLHCASVSCQTPFNAIKVSHHGSSHSHLGRVCGTKPSAPPFVAAVSAGTREALPDRRVLAAYLDEGWSVVCTTTRHGQRRSTTSPMQLANRGGSKGGPQSHLIRVAWGATTGLDVTPGSAAIGRDDLVNYETSKR